VTVGRPYSASWLHAVVRAVDRLPGPTWLAYLAILVVALLFWHLIAWSRGVAGWGALDATHTFWGFLAPALIGIAAYVEKSAAGAFEAFRPGLTLGPAEASSLRHSLVVIPAEPALALTAVAAAVTVVDMVVNAETPNYSGLNVATAVATFAGQAFYIAILLQLLYRTVRQARLVSRTLDRHVVIDIFRPGPLHAFASLTARPGAALTLVSAASLPFVPFGTTTEEIVAALPYVTVPPAVAVLAFVIPLTGAHGRLVEQKEQLKAEADERLRGLLEKINRGIDREDVSRADGLNKMLASLLAQRDVLARLPTWPWSLGTLRGFISAILLPLTLFVLQQVLSRLLAQA
jgi:hypothetical protein